MQSKGLDGDAGYRNGYAQLAVALNTLAIEDLDRVVERHADCSAIYRAAVKGVGLELVAKDINIASNTVTAIQAPDVKDLWRGYTVSSSLPGLNSYGR